ncbi:MAG: glycosyltransferase family 39 protein, partial [Cyclobacteriaceae bacterium]|nr:glycosyltransferase family 39 protein [Cyclobacteriaceae bacterium]
SPALPVLAKIAHWLGGSVFAIRLFPALIGSLKLVLCCLLAKDLSGRTWAVIFTGVFLLFSPSLLASGTLFQPVTLNQLFWIFSAFLLVKILKSGHRKYWWWLGIVVGLGLLTKYSIVFYILALILALLLTGRAKLFTTKGPYLAIVLALIVFLPNIIWQYQHKWPVVDHMQALQDSQLELIDWQHFLSSQIRFHYLLGVIWLMGLWGFFRIEKLRPYKFLGLAFLGSILFIGLAQGKAYYTLGAFLPLFAAGGVTLEYYLKSTSMRIGLIALCVLFTLPVLPYSLPLMQVSSLKTYNKIMPNYLGVKQKLRWEDNKYYDLPQDMADMHGWEELAQRVAAVYHSLSEEEKSKCLIYGGSYAHASVLNYYRQRYSLPTAYSFSGTHILWAEPQEDYHTQIMIDDQLQYTSQWFNQMSMVDSIKNPYAREPGYIYLRADPKIDVVKAWNELVTQERSRYSRQ